MSLSSTIAKIGENINFISFWAHAGFAFIALSFFPHIWVAGALLLAAAWKEFYFDIHFETNPPQNYKDGLLDFSGYAAGVALFFINIALWF